MTTTSPDVEPIFPSVVAQLPYDVIKQFRQFSILKPDLKLTVEAMLLAQGIINVIIIIFNIIVIIISYLHRHDELEFF